MIINFIDLKFIGQHDKIKKNLGMVYLPSPPNLFNDTRLY